MLEAEPRLGVLSYSYYGYPIFHAHVKPFIFLCIFPDIFLKSPLQNGGLYVWNRKFFAQL